MSKSAIELASHLEMYNKRLMKFVEGLDEKGLDTNIPSLGITVRTIATQLSGPRYFGLSRMISVFLDGGEFPDMESREILEAGRAYLEASSGWDKSRILEALENEGGDAVRRLESLTDDELNRCMNLKSFGNEISLQQAIDWIIIGASVEALEMMRGAVFQGTPLD